MSHPHVARVPNNITFPAWMVKALVTAVIGVLVTGSVAMVYRISDRTHTHDTRIEVLEDHQKGIDKKLDTIDKSLDKMDDKLDKLLEQGKPRYRDGIPVR